MEQNARVPSEGHKKQYVTGAGWVNIQIMAVLTDQ
jgi:hypothetical protein